MLCEVVSIAACAAVKPRSAVCSPVKLGIAMVSLDLEVQGPTVGGVRDGHGGGPLASAVIDRLAALAGQPQQVVEERELLAHERAVDVVLALGLLKQAAKLRAAL